MPIKWYNDCKKGDVEMDIATIAKTHDKLTNIMSDFASKVHNDIIMPFEQFLDKNPQIKALLDTTIEESEEA